ncbi:MAG TPA: NifU N-terminal domain-containing protein [Acidimicrobiia bacterium]
MGAPDLGPDLDAARREVAARGLVGEAVVHLNDIVTALPLDALGPIKQQLKRFFSDAPWTAADDAALADLVGDGAGGGRRDLAPDLTMTWGRIDGRFRIRVERTAGHGHGAGDDLFDLPEATDLEASFDGPVTPEATPSPRTIRFATPARHGGPSRSYDSAADAEDDPRVERIFRDLDSVTNVLVGPDFVAVSLDRPARWESLLAPVLAAVTDGFAAEATDEPAPTGQTRPGSSPPVGRSFSVGTDVGAETRTRHLERAWSELGGLDANRPRDLDRLVAASQDAEPSRRQVAATLVADGPKDVASGLWSRLLGDRSRNVRRSTVDAIVGTERADVRPLLERALLDDDAWVRWKALKGIARLGVGPSRDAVAARRDDGDFRVRLEAVAALRD